MEELTSDGKFPWHEKEKEGGDKKRNEEKGRRRRGEENKEERLSSSPLRAHVWGEEEEVLPYARKCAWGEEKEEAG